ncbi:putative MFS family arabinose efflux permease [Neorhizobium sp. R1-B]|uniref:MFS transporter n=1 Tax=Neorhizobium TaxID=1525371 RepID=UPI000CFA2F96|nr:MULTISPECIES: MFS transporter [Neorhizobium]TCV61780.1 putative MFS family arabinose efflux permease [Neorhizobium sp. S3-V5DH]TDX77795.1 putative MFS family arabinose efflux permease [Neorhizobium sp. R1-B]
MNGQTLEAASPFSIASIVVSMTIAAIGSGVMFAYVPFMLTHSAAPWAAGAAVTAVAFGGLVGCVIGGPLIKRVGHARLFACSMAMVIIAAVLIAADLPPLYWILARGLYGAAANVNFIIAQSWLNHAASNEWRGKAMSFFYMAYVLGLGCGAWIFGQIPTDGNLAPLAVVFFTALAILPIGLTRLPNPPPPASVSVNVKMAWRISPVGLVGVLASGGLSMVVQGFTPIYAATNQVSQKDVALLMFVMQTGLLFIQYPLGVLSDRIDRRAVLVITCGLIVAAGIAALFVSFATILLLMIVFLVFGGAIETVYSVANAHANDRADPGDFVPLSSTLLVAWSTAATIVPLGVTLLTPVFGQHTFIYAIILVAIAYGTYVIWRLKERKAVPADERENIGIRSAQVPNASVLTDPETGKPAQ